MKTVCSFFVKFASVISWILSCFDRVIFKGHLSISRVSEFERFVDYVLKIRRASRMKRVSASVTIRWISASPGSPPKSLNAVP